MENEQATDNVGFQTKDNQNEVFCGPLSPLQCSNLFTIVKGHAWETFLKLSQQYYQLKIINSTSVAVRNFMKSI